LYRYEVFLSYRRGYINSRWLNEHFIPLFQDGLKEEIADRCDRKPDGLFHDESEIRAGMSIPARVQEGLKTARSLVALVSPTYFQSDWCRVEWESFKQRSERERRDLIVPAILKSGATVRARVGDTLSVDFSAYTIIGGGFTKTERYVQFQDEIKKLASSVAEIVANAPAWKDFEICNPPRAPAPPSPQISLIGL